MKTLYIIIVATVWSLSCRAAESQDLQLKDGRLLKNAKIIGIGKEQATILSRDGTVSVPLEIVELEDLAYANIRLEDETKDRKKKTEDIAKRDADRRAEQTRAAKAREETALVSASVMRAPAADDRGAKLMALKAKFPPKRRERVTVKTGIIEIDVPHIDVWSFYSGSFGTTTVQALPKTIAKVEERRAQDIAMWSKKLADARQPGTATEAKTTLEWLQRALAAYIEEARRLAQ